MKSKFLVMAITVSAASFASAQFYAIGGLAPNSGSITAAGGGQAFGTSRVTQGQVSFGQRAFVWSPSGGVRSIGTLGPANSLGSTVVNGVYGGRALGSSEFYQGNAMKGPRAFVWDEANGMRSLGSLGLDDAGRGWSSAVAADGKYVYGNTQYRVGDNYMNHAFIWDEAGGMRSMGTLGTSATGAGRSTLVAVDGGRAFGYSDLYENGAHKGQYAYVWDEANGMRSLGTLGVNGSGSSFTTLVDAEGGRAFGDSPLFVNGVSKGTRGFVWDDANGIRSIGTASTNSSGYGISSIRGAAGDLAFGNYGEFRSDDSSAGDRAFVWDDAKGIRSLGTLGTATNGYGSSDAYASDGKRVFGTSFRYEGGVLQGQRAFVWDEANGMQDLNDVLAGLTPTGWTLADVRVAQDGWIFGAALTPNGTQAWGYRYAPVPEPATLAVLGLGALAVVRRRRRA